MYREFYHAERWHTNFQPPMLSVDKIGDIFQFDFITFCHERLGETCGKLLKFYMKVGNVYYTS